MYTRRKVTRGKIAVWGRRKSASKCLQYLISFLITLTVQQFTSASTTGTANYSRSNNVINGHHVVFICLRRFFREELGFEKRTVCNDSSEELGNPGIGTVLEGSASASGTHSSGMMCSGNHLSSTFVLPSSSTRRASTLLWSKTAFAGAVSTFPRVIFSVTSRSRCCRPSMIPESK